MPGALGSELRRLQPSVPESQGEKCNFGWREVTDVSPGINVGINVFAEPTEDARHSA